MTSTPLCALQEQAEDLSQMWGTKKKEDLVNKKLKCEFKFLVCDCMASRYSANNPHACHMF